MKCVYTVASRFLQLPDLSPVNLHQLDVTFTCKQGHLVERIFGLVIWLLDPGHSRSIVARNHAFGHVPLSHLASFLWPLNPVSCSTCAQFSTRPPSPETIPGSLLSAL